MVEGKGGGCNGATEDAMEQAYTTLHIASYIGVCTGLRMRWSSHDTMNVMKQVYITLHRQAKRCYGIKSLYLWASARSF